MASPGLRALLPPPERRGCVLIDPPYEERDDFTRVHRRRDGRAAAIRKRGAAAVAAGQTAQRFRRTGSRPCGAGVDRPVLASLLWMHPCDSRAALNGSALVVVNPPYLVEEGMREWLPELQAMLGGRTVGL